MTGTIHTVIVEDNRLVRDGLTSLLKAQKDFRIVAAVDTPKECLACVEETKPHVVLVDAALGRNGSRHLVSEIRARVPETKVIVMDLLPSEQEIIDFIKAGSNGLRSPGTAGSRACVSCSPSGWPPCWNGPAGPSGTGSKTG